MVREGMSAIPKNAPEPVPPDEPGRTTSEDADLDELRGLARTLAQTLAPGGSAPDDAAALQGWVEGTTGQQIRISQSQIEALIALGAFGRVVGEGRTRLVAITQPTIGRGSSVDNEIDQLSALADSLGAAMPRGGSIADSVDEVSSLIGEQMSVSARHLEALVALGIVGRITSAGQTRLVWMRDDEIGATSTLDPGTEEFRLDIAIDLEHERRLLYRVTLIFELVMLIVIIRQIILGII
jgi:hypothetical protein